MKKYLFIAIVAIGGLATSCTTDNDYLENPNLNDTPKHSDYQDIITQRDSTGVSDTGGQTGNNPIKP